MSDGTFKVLMRDFSGDVEKAYKYGIYNKFKQGLNQKDENIVNWCLKRGAARLSV